MLAFTVLEVVERALTEMAAEEPAGETLEQKEARLAEAIRQINDEEQKNYDAIFSTPVPELLLTQFEANQWPKNGTDESVKLRMQPIQPYETFIKHPSFCHTGLLPAEIRYKGLLTENFAETGDPWDQVYEKAKMVSKVRAAEGQDKPGFVDERHPEQMLLLSADEEWEECEDLIHVDHKDFFYLSSYEGWRTLTLPNQASKDYYKEFNAQTSNGWIFACPARCAYCCSVVCDIHPPAGAAPDTNVACFLAGDWGHCKAGDIRAQFMEGRMDGGAEGKIEIQVNGVPVTDVGCMPECCALMHDDPTPAGKMKWTPNANGQYEIRMQITGSAEIAYLRMSSYVLM